MSSQSLYLHDNSVHPQILLDDVYKIHLVENVQFYTMTTDYTNRCIGLFDGDSSSDKKYYFVIDLVHHDAFGHWVYESAIYLPLFSRLRELYPGIQLLLKERKRYKSMFLQFFNIDEADVCYSIDTGYCNLCLFPSLISSLNDNRFFTDDYKRILTNFMNIFHDYEPPSASTMVSYDHVIMPRQTLENYKHNDRFYPIMDNLIQKLGVGSLVVNTDTLVELAEQIRLVRSAPIVILTDGSPFIVNILFCRNQSIYVVDNITLSQMNLYSKYRFIIESICHMNSIKYKHIDKNSSIF
jgi:hypothetical protein